MTRGAGLSGKAPMPFEYGCFVSHVHAQEPLMQEFIGGLVKALKSELEPYLENPVYIDEERLGTGFKFNPALAHGLCASACWVMVYVPQYSKHPYCLREFRAMQVLEEQRRHDLGGRLKPHQGMILPIILRGTPKQLPAGLGEEVHCLEFNRFTTATGEILRNTSYIEKVQALASYIDEIFQLGEELDHDCAQFSIPQLDGDTGFAPPDQQFPGRVNPDEDSGADR